MYSSEEIKDLIAKAQDHELNEEYSACRSVSFIAISKTLMNIADTLSGENPLICPSCKLQFVNTLELRNHNQDFHGQSPYFDAKDQAESAKSALEHLGKELSR